ncbi:creatininase family protein, partial [Candidatus Bathyarchaeota archaeon]|nr:creatininase family protein [Candidatus Bathyarchaeota archaeon]
MSSESSVRLEHLTWVEAEKAFNRCEVVVIPLGARTKEHGLHLPLNNDWVMAEYLTERVAAEVPVIIMPTLQYGYYPSFTEYPGSVTLELETFRDVVVEICLSLS